MQFDVLKGQVEDRVEVWSANPFYNSELPKKTAIFKQNEEQEQIIPKETILKIERAPTKSQKEKYKVNVIIDYNDTRDLYDKAEGDRQSVLKFWYKLHAPNYKIGTLPKDKFYFEDGKFIIHDGDVKKFIVLPEDQVSIKIVKDGDDHSLAIINDTGEATSSVSKIDNLDC